MKILHLASFTGNIGDNANHLGFRPWFERMISRQVSWSDLEIREFYWKQRRFDQSFADYANTFDLVVIGGGNYFELWVDGSHTGTSLDIPLEIFSQITVPIFFNALGCDEGQGVTANTVTRFNEFMTRLMESRQYLVTVRNDGATATIQKHCPPAIAEKVFTIPDGGFFFLPERHGCSTFKTGGMLVGINLACDMPGVRFRNFGESDGHDRFCDEFGGMINVLADQREDLEFILFPHIHSDLKIVSDVFARLNDRLRRTRVKVAPYLMGAEGARYVFGLYRCCDLILGMRFHANVCPLGMGIPTVGMCNYPQIKHLYHEIGMSDGYVDVAVPGFSADLQRRLVDAREGMESLKSSIGEKKDKVHTQRRAFEPVLIEWLRGNNFL